jgi:hypothetical protein
MMTETRRTLPIGIQTFAKIREGHYYYVDKAEMAWRLAQEAGYFFLSRPRRFGKSLFLDTLGELFEGNQGLFQGLAVHDRWDWSRRYPVIRISFGGGILQSREELDRRLFNTLRLNRESLGLVYPELTDIACAFAELIRQAHARHGRHVVILIDE